MELAASTPLRLDRLLAFVGSDFTSLALVDRIPREAT